jgi:glycine betaine/proline transport system permease protein
VTAAPIGIAVERRVDVERLVPLAVLGVGVAALQIAFASADSFPAELDTTFSDPIDRAGAWMRSNRLDRTIEGRFDPGHPLFTKFFTPISNFIDGAIGNLTDLLLWAPWFVVIAAIALVPLSRRMWPEAAAVVTALVYTGLFDLWKPSMETLSLMTVSVLLAVAIGLPLGVWAALQPRVESVLRPVLDAMQTIPAFVYFLPLFMLLGIGNTPAAVATVIYALPPVVRLTTLGIKHVPDAAVEASTMFGASRRQTLVKVQLPMALRTIVTGMSQTVMMALGIVVLATLVGATGLGSPILQSLNQRRPGRGLAAGFAIVAIAMVLDRVSRAVADNDPTRRASRRWQLGAFAAIVAAVVVGRSAGWSTFPAAWDWTSFDPVDDAINWLRDNSRPVTRWITDVVTTKLYLPPRDFLTDTVAWPVPVFVTGWACWRIRGIGLAVFAASALTTIGLIGLWEPAIDTLVQVIISTVLTLLIAIPLGVWAGRNRRVERTIGPILDAFQTMPSLVYIIPCVVLFTVGVVPGIIATIVYAMVPGVRITALGIQGVAHESLEASQTFGATPRQTLFGVRLPLAAPTIMAGVNQVIMMVLAMVIIAGLVGAGGLGFMVTESLARSYFGQGFEVGLALVLMAMVLDRFTEAWADRLQPPSTP